MKHSTTEISGNFSLWQEFVDPDGTMSESEFDAMSVRDKNLHQRACFPVECEDVDSRGNEII